jgi:hypothetical protein
MICPTCKGSGEVPDPVTDPVPATAPQDWEDKAYLVRFPDVAADAYFVGHPLDHYYSSGQREIEAGQRPDWKPMGWSSAAYLKYNSDVAADPYYKDHPLEHYWSSGYKDKNRFFSTGHPLPTPVTPSAPITPGSWTPPATPGMHEICSRPGPFFMSGLRVPDGLLLGTYRPAKLYKFNGAMNELLSLPAESVYMLYMPPDGLPLFSTECPAQVYKMTTAGQWERKFTRSESNSLAFDIMPSRDGLILFTVDVVNSRNIRIYKGDANGHVWNALRDHTGHFKQVCTDGQTYYLGGEKDGLPYIEDQNGKQIMKDTAYVGQEINYAVVKDGIFTLGMNNIADLIADGTRRNGYINYLENGNDISGIDCKPPWIMNIRIDPVTKYRYAIASIWNESGYPNPELVMSKDGRKWSKIADVPMPSVQTLEIADNGVYCYGGQYGQFGKVCFYRF